MSDNDKTEIVNASFEMIDKTFPDRKNIDKSKLQLTNIGMFSVTGKRGSKFISQIIYKYMKKSRDITITDGTGNNGSDTIAFGIYFKHVNSIELDKVNYDVLKNNVDAYGLKNVNVIHGDTLVELDKLKQDVIYIDAPWGGKDYKKFSHMSLYLGNMELADIYNKYKHNAKLFIFKLPYNYDINKFIRRTNAKFIKIYNFMRENHNSTLFMIMVVRSH